MRYFLLVGVFLSCLVLKASIAAGAVAESSGYVGRVIASEEDDFTEDSLPFPAKKNRSAIHDSNGGVSLAPMVGATMLTNTWNVRVSNTYSTGLLFEIPLSQLFSFELEGSYGKYWIQNGPVYPGHGITQFGIGGDGKVYLIRNGSFRPYLGVGLIALDYENLMGRVNLFPGLASYNQWVGTAQAMVGADIGITEDVSLGVRGIYGLPLIGRPQYLTNGVVPRPGDEERAVADSQYIRVMGSLKVTF